MGWPKSSSGPSPAPTSVERQELFCVQIALGVHKKSILPISVGANVYAQRTAHSEPGTIAPRDCDGKMIVALFAQRSPGTPRATGDDSAVARLRWFERSLDRLGSLMAASGAEAVAMPFNIGCGLAGGAWPAYRKRLDDFASRYAVSVRLYDLDGVSAASLGSNRES